MKSKCILIADSGSTKTDWCLLQSSKKKMLSTQGINPFFMMENDIVMILQDELKLNPTKIKLDEIHFYGAGINSDDKKKVIEKSLRKYFDVKKVNSYSDMLASARATCQHKKGIACILGTGSNTCLYDGKKIGFKTHALGYVLGDEGGGTSIGKKVLQYYLHEIFDENLLSKFVTQFGVSKDEILENIYRKPFPNRYLAKFTQFVIDNRGHYMIENIAEDCLNDLFINHLLRYPKIHQTPVHFTGSVAWHLKDILTNLAAQYDIQLGKVLQKPIKGLIDYHGK